MKNVTTQKPTGELIATQRKLQIILAASSGRDPRSIVACYRGESVNPSTHTAVTLGAEALGWPAPPPNVRPKPKPGRRPAVPAPSLPTP